jgi:hypothetical protein
MRKGTLASLIRTVSCAHGHSCLRCTSTVAGGALAERPRDYAFDFTASNIRFGSGVVREVGADAARLGMTNVVVVTDANMKRLRPLQTVCDALHAHKVPALFALLPFASL